MSYDDSAGRPRIDWGASRPQHPGFAPEPPSNTFGELFESAGNDSAALGGLFDEPAAAEVPAADSWVQQHVPAWGQPEVPDAAPTVPDGDPAFAAPYAGSADNLDDLFSDDEPASGSTADGADSLNDLFSDDEPVSPGEGQVMEAPHSVEAEAGLTALFDSPVPAEDPASAPEENAAAPEEIGSMPEAATAAQVPGPAEAPAMSTPVRTAPTGWTIPGAKRPLRLPQKSAGEPSNADQASDGAPDAAGELVEVAEAPPAEPEVAAGPSTVEVAAVPVENSGPVGNSVEQPAEPGADMTTWAPPAGAAVAAEDPHADRAAATGPDPAAAAPPSGMRISERVQAALGARLGGDDAASIEARAMIGQQSARWGVIDQLYTYVNQILGFVSSTPQLHGLNRLVLTRDPVLDHQQRRQFQETIAPLLIRSGITIGVPAQIDAVFDLAYDEMIGIGPLGELWRNQAVTDILVDSWDRIVVEMNGHLVDTPVRFRDPDHARTVARNLASKISDRALSDQSPLVTAELPGARVTFAVGSIVRSGLSISLRKAQPLMGMSRLLELGSISPQMRDFLAACVIARATILVSGGTGTGKTTMINALSEFIPPEERVVTIEDSFELSLANRHVVSLQTKERASADDDIRITQEMLLVNTLRMRPDRIIVGEIREPEGARVMLQAANTGHDGTMTTIHANTPEAALNERLSDMLRGAKSVPDDVAKREVSMAIDLVVQVTRRQGLRYVSAIAAVDRTSVRADSRSAQIVPTPIFVGDLQPGPTGTPVAVYRHVGGLGTDTDLAVKLADAGFDVSDWEEPA